MRIKGLRRSHILCFNSGYLSRVDLNSVIITVIIVIVEIIVIAVVIVEIILVSWICRVSRFRRGFTVVILFSRIFRTCRVPRVLLWIFILNIVRSVGFIFTPVISAMATIPLVVLLFILYFEVFKLPDKRLLLLLIVVQESVLSSSVFVVKMWLIRSPLWVTGTIQVSNIWENIDIVIIIVIIGDCNL